MTSAKANRRSFLVGGASFLGMMAVSEAARTQEAAFTPWGWPQGYEKVSDKSVDWLKKKGWWPLQIAFQAPWSGQNNVNIVADKKGLLAKRGLEAKWQAFGSGPAINEMLVAGRAQVANSGNFPYTLLLDNQIPVKAIAILTPNVLHATIVPLTSKYKSLADFKGATPPVTIGIVTGSSAEFYFQMAAAVHGLSIGKDVILKNMTIGDQMAFPKGLDAIVPWDPAASVILEERKNGRAIDTIYPYNMYEGNYAVREELIQNVPDVVQALCDAYVEALLWSRLYIDETVALLQQDPNLKDFSKKILTQQTRAYNVLYKPTFVYPHAKFWGEVNEPIFTWLYDNRRIRRKLKAEDFEKSVDTTFISKTFGKLGWAIPKIPPFLPSNWNGSPSKLPFPDYATPVNLKVPQPFPESGDLTKPWSFGGKTFSL